MPAYLAEFEAEYRRLGFQPFVEMHPWPMSMLFHLPRGFGEYLRERAQPSLEVEDEFSSNANKKVI